MVACIPITLIFWAALDRPIEATVVALIGFVLGFDIGWARSRDRRRFLPVARPGTRISQSGRKDGTLSGYDTLGDDFELAPNHAEVLGVCALAKAPFIGDRLVNSEVREEFAPTDGVWLFHTRDSKRRPVFLDATGILSMLQLTRPRRALRGVDATLHTLERLREDVAAPELVFLALARRWHSELERARPDRALPGSMDDLALAALLVSVDEGPSFSSQALEQIERNTASLEARQSGIWIDRLPWVLCQDSTDDRLREGRGIESLTNNLDHHQASVRLWLMDIAWMVRAWLDPRDALPRLFKNVADTLGGALRAGALAAAITPTADEFWSAAEAFEPDPRFADQLHYRLDLLRDRPILPHQAHFLKREVKCRKLIGDSVFRREQREAPS